MLFKADYGNAPGGGRRRILRIQLLALLPVMLAALVNSGYQYFQGMALLPSLTAATCAVGLSAFCL